MTATTPARFHISSLDIFDSVRAEPRWCCYAYRWIVPRALLGKPTIEAERPPVAGHAAGGSASKNESTPVIAERHIRQLNAFVLVAVDAILVG